MMTNRRAHRIGAMLMTGVLVMAACSDYEGVVGSQSAERSAGQAEDQDWDAVDPAQGGNGYASWTLGEDYCFTTFNGDKGWNTAYINLCFYLANETRRFTSERGTWRKFPLTVTKFWSGNSYPNLGGEKRSGYWGVLQGNSNCDTECNGRLSPNPFDNTAVMQFGGQGSSGAMDTGGAKVRLFLNTGASPMRLSDTSSQPEYDLPYWSSTNYHSCNQGAWLTCIKDPNMPNKGASVIARFRVGTLPLEIDVINALGVRTTLQRQGDPQVSGLLLDPIAERNVATVGPEQVATYGGYRAADGRTASFTARYIVADTAGNTSPAACKASDTRPLGCGTTLDMSVNIDKDGKSTWSCVPSPTDTRIVKCEITVLGSPTGPMTATVRVADF